MAKSNPWLGSSSSVKEAVLGKDTANGTVLSRYGNITASVVGPKTYVGKRRR